MRKPAAQQRERVLGALVVLLLHHGRAGRAAGHHGDAGAAGQRDMADVRRRAVAARDRRALLGQQVAEPGRSGGLGSRMTGNRAARRRSGGPDRPRRGCSPGRERNARKYA
ncbi:hypothetical protein [Streptomyces sp. NBC_01602]|uniref:hypothetical protein n=1 Tax=Streptomyces sp. NBC_01602 TaxID=2975893 RepID=UPI003870183E